jgi:nucleoid-associated protein YgaU
MKPASRPSGVCRSVVWGILVAVCCFLGGCSIDPFGSKQEVREVRTSTREDIRITQGDMERLREEVENLSARFESLSSTQEREMQALRNAVDGLESRVAQTNNTVLGEVDRRIAEAEAKSVADRNQLAAKVNDVVERINALSQRMKTLTTSRPVRTETVSEKGIEYTVEERDSLWGIASKFKEYGVTVDAIRQANNMQPTDNRIVPGQKLFIPVKQ